MNSHEHFCIFHPTLNPRCIFLEQLTTTKHALHQQGKELVKATANNTTGATAIARLEASIQTMNVLCTERGGTIALLKEETKAGQQHRQVADESKERIQVRIQTIGLQITIHWTILVDVYTLLVKTDTFRHWTRKFRWYGMSCCF